MALLKPLCLSSKMELSSENATKEEILAPFYAVTLDCDIQEPKATLLAVLHLKGNEPRDPVAKIHPNS